MAVLPPLVLVAIYFVVCMLTVQLINAMDPLQEMLMGAGAYSWLDGDDRSNAIKAAVGLGSSCSVLSGMVVGIILDLIGPKIVAVAGHAFIGAGFSLMFFSNSSLLITTGCVLLGISFQCIINSHLSVSCLFPTSVAFVLSILGAAPDVSLYVPALLKDMALKGCDLTDGLCVADNTRRVIRNYLLFVIVPCAVLDFFLVPLRPHSLEEPNDGASEKLNDDRYGSCYGTGGDVEASRTSGPVDYKKLSLKQQLMTSHYLVFIPFFVCNFFRRKNFASNNRDMFVQMAGGDAKRGGSFTELFNLLVPFGFIPAIVWGLFVDKCGIVAAAIANNIFGCGVALLPMIPLMSVQYITIGAYVLFSSYMFGLLYAYLASVYGFSNFATLQGVASFLAGLTSSVMDLYWNPFITNVLGGSYFKANIIVAVISFLMFLTPIYLLINPPPQPVESPKEEPRQVFDAKTFSISGQYYDKASLNAMSRMKAY